MWADETIPISAAKLISIGSKVEIFKRRRHLLMGRWAFKVSINLFPMDTMDFHDWGLIMVTINKCLIKGLSFNWVKRIVLINYYPAVTLRNVCTLDSVTWWPFLNVHLDLEMWPDDNQSSLFPAHFPVIYKQISLYITLFNAVSHLSNYTE